MKKIISVILTLTLILSFSATVFASETETVGGKITLTQFLGATLDNTTGITLSYDGTTITANANDFYAIADKIILTSQFDIKQTNMDGLYITSRKQDDTFEYAYITANGEADKYSQVMSRLPYAMYVADDTQLVGELIALVSVNIPSISDWAEETIARANAEGFIPENFGVSNYTQNITREKFCDLAFEMLHKTINLQWYTTSDVPFKDTNNMSVGTLYKNGIIYGKGEGIFAPNDPLTREEAAVILYRMANFLEMNIFLPDYRLSSYYFYDNDNISDWAKEAVYQLHYAGIFKGVGNDLFAPLETYTIEQAIATMIRLFDIQSNYENAAAVVRKYFDAYAKADYETMKQYSTARHIEQCFHDGDVWGNKWAKLISIEPVNKTADNDKCIFSVSVEMETVPASSQYPDTKGGFYVMLKLENGVWKIDKYATGL